MTSVTELLQNAELSLKGSETPRLDAEILLCDVMHFNRSKIYSHPEQIISDEKLSLFGSLIEQRRQGHPVAHLTGKKEFWSLQLAIDENTLIPRPETELLVETALQIIPADTAFNILDLGTGSGAIAIAIASERPDCEIIACDINANALTIARQNAETHQLKNIQFYLSNWYQDIPVRTFDLIVSNPPYIKQDDEHLSRGDVRFESELALVAGVDGMLAINIIIKNARSYLSSNASLLIEHAYDQKLSVQESLLKYDFKQLKTFQDLSGQDRLTIGQSPD